MPDGLSIDNTFPWRSRGFLPAALPRATAKPGESLAPALATNGGSDQRLKRFQIGVFFRQIPEGTVHLEANLEIRFRIVDVAEKRLVATHIVIINGLFEERDRTCNQKVFCFRGFSELMQAKTGMKKSGAGIGRDAAELLADPKGEGPFLFSHEMMQAKLKHFRTILKAVSYRVEFRD